MGFMHGLGRRLLLPATTAVVALVSTVVPTASAVTVDEVIACGAVITQDVILTRDLRACPTDGLSVVAPGVTLDLNGHQIVGAGAGSGVVVNAQDVTVKNGTVSGFDAGIQATRQDFGTTFRLASMTVVENRTGVVTGNVSGARLHDVTIESSRIERNDEVGVTVQFAGVLMSDTRVRRNGSHGIVALEAFPSRYEENDISGNGGHGLFLDDSTSTMIDNRFDRNGLDGLRVSDRFVELALYFSQANQANHNGGLGFAITAGAPTKGSDGGENVAKGNGDSRQCVVEDPLGHVLPDALVCDRN
jgi:hypothetical protein